MPYDTQIDAPLNILSLDGGGVKGLSSLLILRQVMTELSIKLDKPNIAPWQFFDLICGASTGGIIALMLGRLRMTVDECIQAYTTLAKEVFEHKNDGWASPEDGSPAYDHKRLEAGLRRLVEERCGDAEALMVDPNGTECRVFVLGVKRDWADAPPHRFRTYPGFKDDNPTTYKVWQAARATSSTFEFFEPFTFLNQTWTDTAFGYNNPTGEARAEAEAIWGKRPVGCLLSLGTGEGRVVSMSGEHNGEKLNSAMVKISNSCRRVHNNVGMFYRRVRPNPYFRFNVDRGLDDMKMDDWEQMEGKGGEITGITLSYMLFEDQQQRSTNCVKVLAAKKVEELEPALL